MTQKYLNRREVVKKIAKIRGNLILPDWPNVTCMAIVQNQLDTQEYLCSVDY